jgi:hypothetical protein
VTASESKAALLKIELAELAEQKAEELKSHQKELMRKFLSKFPPKKPQNLHYERMEER